MKAKTKTGANSTKQNQKSRTQQGITLIALVITIIVLLILAGVAINLALDSNGIFSRANEAVEKYNNGVAKEEQTLTEILDEMESAATKKNIPNRPKLVAGMTPVKYTLPTGDKPGELVKTNAGDSEWYNYDEQRWANAQTEDGSLWVWIPRYAYRIEEETQTTEVVFLRGNGDNYYDDEGNVQTAKRCKSTTDKIDTTTGFTVHPAFTDESKINYRNGGWNSELTGIWVAKFEAGYAGGNNSAPQKDTNVGYTQGNVWGGAIETTGGTADGVVSARNWYLGDKVEVNTEDSTKSTKFKYPTFQPLTYSLNYITHGEAYSLAKAMTDEGNIYGFTKSTTDTHLIKDSEWGMISYLSKSKYGLKETDICVNNINLNGGGNKESKEAGNQYATIYAVTGCTTASIDEITGQSKEGPKDVTDRDATVSAATDNKATIDGVYKWNQTDGQKASTTGNLYGIYDLSGGAIEMTAGYVSNGNGNIDNGKSFATKTGGKSDQYVKVYAYDADKDNTGGTADEASEANYKLNAHVYGNTMNETSNEGTAETYSSWYGDTSTFISLECPFSQHGGIWNWGHCSGIFAFYRGTGGPTYTVGFRSVVIAK